MGMEQACQAAADAIKQHIQKYLPVENEMYKKYIVAKPEVIATYTTYDADMEKLETALEKLEKIPAMVYIVHQAAGSFNAGTGGTHNMKTLITTMKKRISEAKASKPKGPAPVQNKPGGVVTKNTGRPLPKTPPRGGGNANGGLGRVDAFGKPLPPGYLG